MANILLKNEEQERENKRVLESFRGDSNNKEDREKAEYIARKSKEIYENRNKR